MNSTTRFFKESTKPLVLEGSLGGVLDQFLKQLCSVRNVPYLLRNHG